MRSFVVTAALAATPCFCVFAQGPLTPPGPPAPLMKTLAQIEARTPIDAVNTPGDAGSTFIISTPGSYYLTGNVNGESGKHGIFVNADNVTIDLNGFTMTGPGTNSAITMPAPPSAPENTAVQNGTIKNWGFAVSLRERARVDRLTVIRNIFDGLSTGNGSLIVDCVVSNNGQNGIGTGSGSVVRSIVASDNGGNGIAAGGASVISGCTATGNGGSGIFSTGGGSTIQNCSSSANGVVGIGGNDRSTVVDCTATNNGGFGIISFDASTVERCTVSANRGEAGIRVENRSQVIGCVADRNGTGATGQGIRTALRGLVKHCTASQNQADGISVSNGSVVLENHASENGRGAAAAGIRNTGAGSRLEANHVRDTLGTGIIATTADVVIRNYSSNNTMGNYRDGAGAVLSGPNIGPIGTVATTSHPAANLQ